MGFKVDRLLVGMLEDSGVFLRTKVSRSSLRGLVAGALLTGAVLSTGVGTIQNAHALPFNDDMVLDQLKTNQVMRPTPEGSVPVGASSRPYQNVGDLAGVSNPLRVDQSTIERGERLWVSNCSPCHGVFTGEEFKRSIPIETGLVPGPDLSLDFYRTRPDEHFFGYIHFGGIALMPRLGWKLSYEEHWEIVSYIRDVQQRGDE